MDNFGELPKDVRIEICKKLDIESRIRLRMIRKLEVPKKLKEKLADVCRAVKQTTGTKNIMYYVDLKLYWIAFDRVIERDRWTVFDIVKPEMHLYSQDTNSWNML
jgi:hypothetical protein